MVVKYRQAERLIKKVNEKINSHADIFQYQAQYRAKKKEFQQIIEAKKKEIQELSRQLYKEKK